MQQYQVMFMRGNQSFAHSLPAESATDALRKWQETNGLADSDWERIEVRAEEDMYREDAVTLMEMVDWAHKRNPERERREPTIAELAWTARISKKTWAELQERP